MPTKFRPGQRVAFSGDRDANYKILRLRGDTATIASYDERFVVCLDTLTPLEPAYMSRAAVMLLDLSPYVAPDSVALANAFAADIQASTYPLSYYTEVTKFQVDGHLGMVTCYIDDEVVGASYLDLDEAGKNVYTTIAGMAYDEFFKMQWDLPERSDADGLE